MEFINIFMSQNELVLRVIRLFATSPERRVREQEVGKLLSPHWNTQFNIVVLKCEETTAENFLNFFFKLNKTKFIYENVLK